MEKMTTPSIRKSKMILPPHFSRCHRPGELVWKICRIEEGLELPVIVWYWQNSRQPGVYQNPVYDF